MASRSRTSSRCGFPGGNFVDWLPGAVDRRVAFEAMVPLTSVLLAGAALVDHCRTRCARIAVLAAVTASAGMMSMVATVDRLTDWSWPFTGDPRFAGGTRFVSFGYHGNAAGVPRARAPRRVLLAITHPTPVGGPAARGPRRSGRNPGRRRGQRLEAGTVAGAASRSCRRGGRPA